jgi:hypothetical protein
MVKAVITLMITVGKIAKEVVVNRSTVSVVELKLHLPWNLEM